MQMMLAYSSGAVNSSVEDPQKRPSRPSSPKLKADQIHLGRLARGGLGWQALRRPIKYRAPSERQYLVPLATVPRPDPQRKQSPRPRLANHLGLSLASTLESTLRQIPKQMQQEQILEWVSSIDANAELVEPHLPAPTPATKTGQLQRKRPLPSPPMSSGDANLNLSTPGSKRPRMDPDRTPRANNLFAPAHSDASSATSSSGHDYDYDDTESAISKRPRSTNSSPTKTTRTLAYLHAEHVIQFEAFDGTKSTRVPSALKELVDAVETDAFGQGIISRRDLELLGPDAQTDPLLSSIFSSPRFVDDTESRDQLGASLSREAVSEILKEAQEAEQMRHSEAHWNCFVHSRILRLALQSSNVNSTTDRDVSKIQISCLNATTAQIIKSFAPRTFRQRHDKRIDFCFYVDLDDAHPARPMLNHVSQESPHGCINHTDYPPLLRRPVCLSLETKRTGEDWQVALEQTSIWLAAQWACLDKLVGTSASATGLDFLPALIVQGHDWWFVAATRHLRPDGLHETILWSKVFMGSTSSARGLYQVVTTIQRLSKWCAQVYWPWFRARVLRLGDA
ncbi:hypothetical protein FDECE_8145 [Fusarium decemcellulare]|nr:hypothetical protein FDECE_8145 [Fusarium decemcellulare]